MSEKGAKEMVPGIRFVGFNGEWEERPLESIYGKIRNAFVGTATPYYVEAGEFYLESNNVKNGKINRIKEVFISDEFHQKQSDKWLVTGDIVMVQSGHVGHTAVIPPELNNTAAHALIMFTDPKEKVCPHFLNTQFQTSKSKTLLVEITTGNTIKHILSSEMKEFEVDAPSFEEQTKIGEYFQQLDVLIAGHRGKWEKLLQIKKSLLEKMFPKQGQDEPEIRFASFDENWAVLSFSDSFKNIPNNTLSRADLNYKRGLAQNVHYGDVLIKFDSLLDVENTNIPFVTNDEISTKLKGTKLHNGDVIIADAAEDSTVGKCTEIMNISDAIIFAGLHTIAVRPVINFSSKYLGYYMNSKAYHDQLMILMQGTKVLSISKTAIQRTNISCPTDLREQTKIGELFKHMDALINQHQSQITKLTNIKQACLAKMFV